MKEFYDRLGEEGMDNEISYFNFINFLEINKETIFSYISYLSEGNPGSLEALRKVCEEEFSPERLNPEEFFDLLRELHGQKILGSNIWICYKDLCGKCTEDFKNGIMDGSLKKKLEKSDDYKWNLKHREER